MTTVEAPAYRARETEAEFQRAVTDAAVALGWLPVHFRQMVGNPAGWPDLLLLRDGRVIVAELKTERGKLGPRQREWIERLAGYGFEVRVWRPSMWDEIERVLREGGDG